jgi:aspartokinase
MVSVPHIVRRLMEEKPFLQECMDLDLLNYVALAEYLLPEVEREVGRRVKPLTVSMALRRISEERRENPLAELVIDERTDLTSKSHLVEYVFKKSDKILDKLNRFSTRIRVDDGDFFSINQGTVNIAVLTNERHAEALESELRGESVVSSRRDLGAIFFSIPLGYREVPGFYYITTRSLAFNNITILMLTNIETDLFFLLHNEDVARAYNVLFDLIQSRRFVKNRKA